MRYFFLFFLLFLLSVPTLAQEDFAMPDLPAAPVFSSAWAIYYAHTDQLAWLDNQTLVFTPYDELYPLETNDNPYETYSYSLADNSLSLLEHPLFRENWDSEWRDYFQAGNNVVYRSPYSSLETWGGVSVFYLSNLFVHCGNECGGGLIMSGSYTNTPDGSRHQFGGSYRNIETHAFGDIRVHWHSSNDALVMEMQVPYGQGKSLYYVETATGRDEHFTFGLFDYPSDQFFAFSPSGHRVALSTHIAFDDNSSLAQENWQKLIIWDVSRHDNACSCTYDPVSHVIYSPTNQEDYRRRNFAGVGFVDEDTILYIGNEGLFRHSISTGESVLLDSAFNTHWINLAIFSPDNRHVAVTTAQGLYVLPTGYEG